MTRDATANQGAKIPPGEGERRAQRGYVPQYDLAARVIYEALAAGRLQWIGLADRGAGAFDDVVLGLYDRIAAYQVKTSRDPEPFSISTALLGAKNLLGRMIESRRKLGEGPSGRAIETIYVCDDYPRTDDNISGSGRSGSSAAFIRMYEAHRLSWSLADWMASPFASFVAQVQTKAGLDDAAFEVTWRNMRFLVGGQGGTLGLGPYSATDGRRLRQLADLLPHLVADHADRDRWTVGELLEQLGWPDPLGLRHGHAFPVDALHQSNERTQEALQGALEDILSGYVSLIGPPGAGKSTLLAAGLLPTPRAIVIRYLAFVPHEGHGLGRGEAFDFLHDIITQLKQQLGVQIMPGAELTELREQFETLLAEASQRFQTEQIKTLIVVDGLDHVPREEKTDHPFLRELPLPHAVPKGVIFILGTQKLDLDGVPPAVRDEAGHNDRCIHVSPLSREAVTRLADATGVPDDVDRADLYDRTQGHPLSTRYIIEGLRGAPTPEGRQKWLRDGPAYGGNVDVFYQRAWHDLERNTEARRALAYVALAEGLIRPVSLDKLVGSGATDAAWDAAGHLMVRNKQKNAWSIFHNSFRIFLCDRTALRHGVSDDNSVRRRCCELANMARTADSTDPQRWMELRYRARAGEHSAVVDLSRPVRFRAQFIEGRNPGDIRNDIEFGFRAAAELRRLLMIAEDCTDILLPFLSSEQIAIAWRITDDVSQDDKRLVASGSRKIKVLA